MQYKEDEEFRDELREALSGWSFEQMRARIILGVVTYCQEYCILEKRAIDLVVQINSLSDEEIMFMMMDLSAIEDEFDIILKKHKIVIKGNRQDGGSKNKRQK